MDQRWVLNRGRVNSSGIGALREGCSWGFGMG